VKKKEPQSDQEVAEWYQASIMAAVSEYCRQLGMSAVAESIVQAQTHPRFHEALTAIRELEVSLQALKEENAMLRGERRIDNEDLAQAYDFARDKGAALERAAVVAWLCAECGSPGHEERFCAYCNVRRNIAAHIERGEHRREEKP